MTRHTKFSRQVHTFVTKLADAKSQDPPIILTRQSDDLEYFDENLFSSTCVQIKPKKTLYQESATSLQLPSMSFTIYDADVMRVFNYLHSTMLEISKAIRRGQDQVTIHFNIKQEANTLAPLMADPEVMPVMEEHADV